ARPPLSRCPGPRSNPRAPAVLAGALAFSGPLAASRDGRPRESIRTPERRQDTSPKPKRGLALRQPSLALRACGRGSVRHPLRALGPHQLGDRLPQQSLAAEGHAQAAQLLRVDLVLRPPVEVRDGAAAAGQLLGEAGHLLFGDVAVVTVERLPRDR